MGGPVFLTAKVLMSRSVEGFDDVTVDVADQEEEDTEVVDELLVEDVSIDSMCGVY